MISTNSVKTQHLTSTIFLDELNVN